MDTPRANLSGDTIVVLALALVLAIGWTFTDWPALSTLRLPDTDDVMRLQQIRDWIAGQPFTDLTQHRLGPDTGLAMHWTRLADLAPAALIAGLTPLLGRHAAELAAVLVWPPLLFAAALLLVIRIARAAGGSSIARTAGVVAAIAYPATTIFLPGRIDHHGLQLVLVLAALLAMTGTGSWRRGAAAGLAAAAGLVVGLETAPLFAAIGAVALVDWTRMRNNADQRLGGLALAAIGGLAIGWLVFAPRVFAYPACDGFTATSLRAAAIAAILPLVLWIAGRYARTTTARATTAILAALLTAGAILAVAPGCATPYGQVDPILRTLWLAQVGEAQSLLSAPIATSIGYLGLMISGIVATMWQCRVAPSRIWAMLLLVQTTALALACVQMRGAYAGAMLAAPALAAAIAAARTRSTLPTIAAWLVSAGILYPIAASALVAPSPAKPAASCDPAALAATLNTLPPGRVIAPIDLGPALIATTRHHLLAAPYHRNDAGNLAVFAFYRGPPASADAIARKSQVAYVVACPAMPDANRAGTMAHALAVDAAPGWHQLPPVTPSGAIFVRDGLSAPPSPH